MQRITAPTLLIVCLFLGRKANNGDVQLEAYPRGRVRIYKDGEWGTLCGHWWWNNQHGASNICKQLGYEGGTKYSAAGGSGTIVAGNRECAGGEATIFDCPLKNSNELAGCTHLYDQGVECTGERMYGYLFSAPDPKATYDSISNADAWPSWEVSIVGDPSPACAKYGRLVRLAGCSVSSCSSSYNEYFSVTYLWIKLMVCYGYYPEANAERKVQCFAEKQQALQQVCHLGWKPFGQSGPSGHFRDPLGCNPSTWPSDVFEAEHTPRGWLNDPQNLLQGEFPSF